MKRKTIVDDWGVTWEFNGERIRCVGTIGDSGFYCETFEHGVALLKKYGYITPKRRPK